MSQFQRPGFRPQQLPPAPRVLVCVPSCDQVQADFAMSLATLMHHLGQQGMPIVLANPRSAYVHRNRNDAVREARKAGLDYLMFFDSDMVFPPDTINRLLARKKEIVGATYRRRVAPYTPLGAPIDGQPQDVSSGCVEVGLMPTGVLLVRMSVFDKLEWPPFQTPVVTYDDQPGEEPRMIGEDYFFCHIARAAGFSVWMDVDLTKEVGHVGQQVYRMTTGAGSEVPPEENRPGR